MYPLYCRHNLCLDCQRRHANQATEQQRAQAELEQRITFHRINIDSCYDKGDRGGLLADLFKEGANPIRRKEGTDTTDEHNQKWKLPELMIEASACRLTAGLDYNQPHRSHSIFYTNVSYSLDQVIIRLNLSEVREGGKARYN